MTTTSPKIFLNSDMGESLGLHTFGNDAALMPMLDAANVACGFHSGDPMAMRTTVGLALASDVRIGAHPGLPDLVGFGRRKMALTPDEVETLIVYQTGALCGFLREAGAELNHIKPHGALWGMLAVDEELMRAATRAVKVFDVPFYGLAGTEHSRICEQEGVPFVGELYVDMDYAPDGTLVISRSPHATDPAAAAERVRTALAGDPIPATDGSPLRLEFDSVCVHSDGPTALEVTRAVRAVLDEQ